MPRRGPVIKGQNDFMIRERQRFSILRRANAGVLLGVHDDRSARAKRIGLFRTLRCIRRRSDHSPYKDHACQYTSSDKTHSFLTPP